MDVLPVFRLSLQYASSNSQTRRELPIRQTPCQEILSPTRRHHPFERDALGASVRSAPPARAERPSKHNSGLGVEHAMGDVDFGPRPAR
jgi:hypothetical protein